jgi:transposase
LITHQKSSDYKETVVQYYLVEDKSQEEVCKIFKCSPRSLMRWVEKYKNIIKDAYERTKKYLSKKNNTRKIKKNYL